MSQESSAGEKPGRGNRWSLEDTAKLADHYKAHGRAATLKKFGISDGTLYGQLAKQKKHRNKRIKQKEEHKPKPRGGVPLYLFTLAKQVRRAAINYLHDGEGGDVLAETALMLARKVMEGDAS